MNVTTAFVIATLFLVSVMITIFMVVWAFEYLHNIMTQSFQAIPHYSS